MKNRARFTLTTLLLSFLFGALLLQPRMALATSQNPNTDFLSGKYGFMIGYSDSADTFDNGGMTIAKWNADVNSFNVPNFVNQIQATGATFVVIYLGQNNGFFLGPNATYETAAGVASGSRMSGRDLVMEIATGLHAIGIKVLLYLPSGGPKNDTPAANAMGFVTPNSTSGDWLINTTNATTWASIIQTWADRYGTLISGWWFDGYYNVSGIKDNSIAQLYANAAHHGNPNSIVTFDPWQYVLNNSLAIPVEDFTPGDAGQYTPPTSRWYNTGSDLEQWNDTFSLNASSSWGLDMAESQTIGNGPNYSTSSLISYLQQVKAGGGSSMLDAKIDWTGFMSPQIYNQMLAVNASLNGNPTGGLLVGQTYALTVNNDGMALTANGTSSPSTVVQQPLTYAATQQWTLVAGSAAGNYELKNVASGLALAITGSSNGNNAPAVVDTYSASSTGDQWQLTNAGGISYEVTNANSGLALEMPGANTSAGTQFDQYDYNSENLHQQFTVIPVPGALVVGQTYEITVDHSGDALTASGTGQGSPVVQQPWAASNSQLWKLVQGTESGYYELQNVASGLALNISGASTEDGGKAIVWPYQNGSGTNDQWALNLSNGFYQIVNKNSGLSLEVPGANQTPGTQFDQWDYNSANAHQHFTLTAR